MRRHPFLAFLAAVVAVKLVVLLQLQDQPLLQPGSGLDSTIYARLASRVASGDLWLGPGLYIVSPLYTYVLAAVLAVAHNFTAARLLQIGLGTAGVAAIHAATAEWFGKRAAWLAAILAALTGLFTFHEVVLLPVALDPALTATGLAALALGLNRLRQPVETGTLWIARPSVWFLASGLSFGIQTLNQPNVALPAITVVVLLAVMRRFRPALLMAAGLTVAVLPLLVRNAIVAGDWSPLSSHGGLSFYIGNNAVADGTYRPVPGVAPDIQGEQRDARRIAEAAAGRTLDDGDVSAYFYGLGLTWIRLHPGDAAALFARKLRDVFNARYIAINYSYPFYAYDLPSILPLLFVGPWLLLPLGLAGLAIGTRVRPPAGARKGSASHGAWRTEYLIWVTFVPAYAFSIATFFVTERSRLPLLVPLCMGSGALMDAGWSLFGVAHGVRRYAPVLVAVLALAVGTNWPMRADDGRMEERMRMAEAMIAQDRYDVADAWLEKAERGAPKPGVLHYRVGRLLLVHRQPDAALAHFTRALQLDPGQPDVEYGIGQALVDAKRFKEAIPHLEKALNAGIQMNLAGFDLARARAGAGDRAGALQTLQGLRPAAASDWQSWDVLGQLAMQLQSPSLAASFLSEAVAAAPRMSKARQDLGLALVMMGRYGEAIPQFQAGVTLDPSDAAAQLNLAVALAESGHGADARVHAQEALRLKPDYDRARQFLKVLK